MNDIVFIEDRVNGKMNLETGELKSLRIGMKKHIEDFFCMYLEAWDDFGEREGYLKTVFTWCIIQSKYSSAGSAQDGNIFHVSEVLNYVRVKYPDKDLKTLRNTISKLHKRGFIIQHEGMRGCYYINPKYGIKGNISENMFAKLSLQAEIEKI